MIILNWNIILVFGKYFGILILLCQMRKMFYISVFKNDEATH